MLNELLNRRLSRLGSDFEYYLRNLERRCTYGLPSLQEARRDYQAAIRSRHAFLP